MATVSVVQYSNTSPHKVSNVLQQSAIINNNNNERREIIILRKPVGPPQKDEVLLTTKKRALQGKPKELSVAKPAPVAVARRNARERNRVKQVNNGFANLRQHIPNYIAAAFETTSGRGGNKKLSKVETLRMAVEYIRRLEVVLGTDSSESTFDLPAGSFNYPSGDEDDLSSTNPTPPPSQRYIKVQINDGIQLLPVHIYEDSENMEPMDESLLSDPSLLSSDLEFNDAVQNLNLLNSMGGNASLSPGMYSDNSLSPNALEKSVHFSESVQNYHHIIPVFQTRHLAEPLGEVKFRLIPPEVKIEPNSPPLHLHASMESFHQLPPLQFQQHSSPIQQTSPVQLIAHPQQISDPQQISHPQQRSHVQQTTHAQQTSHPQQTSPIHHTSPLHHQSSHHDRSSHHDQPSHHDQQSLHNQSSLHDQSLHHASHIQESSRLRQTSPLREPSSLQKSPLHEGASFHQIKLEKQDLSLQGDQKAHVLDVMTWWSQQQSTTS